MTKTARERAREALESVAEHPIPLEGLVVQAPFVTMKLGLPAVTRAIEAAECAARNAALEEAAEEIENGGPAPPYDDRSHECTAWMVRDESARAIRALAARSAETEESKHD